MRSRSVSVTGATGFLGSHLAKGFQDAGWAVRAIVRPGSTGTVPPGIERVECALEPQSLVPALGTSSIVVHAAGLVRSPTAQAFDAVNCGGTDAVVKAANAVGVTVMLVSSQAAAGPGTLSRPVHESDQPCPLTPYGKSKLGAEEIVRGRARVPWIIARPSAVYGPRDRAFLPLFRLAARGLFPIISGSRAVFTLIYVHDLVRGLVLAASDERARSATLFFGHQVPQSLDDLLGGLAHAVGQPYRPLKVPAAVMRAAASIGELAWRVGWEPPLDRARLTELRSEGFVCSVESARDLLGFCAATDWVTGSEETARWYRDHGWL